MSYQPGDYPSPIPSSTDYAAPPAAASRPGWTTVAARVLAGLLAVFFVLACPASLFAFNMERVALNPATYKDALVSMGFYDQLPSLLAAAFSDAIAKDPADNQALAGLSREDIQGIIASLLTRDWSQQQTESVIDQLFAWLNADGTDLHVVVSMTNVKQQMAGPAGKQVVLTIIGSWSPCTDAQLLAATAAVVQGEIARMPACRPPDDLMPSVLPMLSEAATQGAATIPDSIDLASPNGEPTHIDSATDPRPTFHILQWVARLSPLVALLLILGVAVLAVRGWKGMALWLGIPLVAAAIGGGLVAVAMLPLRDVFTRNLFGPTSTVPATFQDVFVRMFGAVFETVGWWIAGESLLIGGAGVVIFLAAYLLGRDRPSTGASSTAEWR